jgi:hypothetical protein
MKRRARIIGVGLLVVLVLVTVVGFLLEGLRTQAGESIGVAASNILSKSAASAPAAAPPTTGEQGTSFGASSGGTARNGAATVDVAAPTAGGAAPPSKNGIPVPSSQQLIVTTGAIALRVKDVPAAVSSIRTFAQTNNVQIANLTYSTGSDSEPPVVALRTDALPSGTSGQPSQAQITLRVPATRLDSVRRAVAALGVVTSESSSQDDVTAQHVDMVARLANMRAEEARLRALYSKAGSVSDLLEVEQELTSVRGDIESAQAELAYLDKQVALSTLDVSLSSPGAVIRPAFGVSWGIGDAVTQGVQTAVAVVRAFITGAIALSPVFALLLLAWGSVWLARRLRPKEVSPEPAESAADQTPDCTHASTFETDDSP